MNDRMRKRTSPCCAYVALWMMQCYAGAAWQQLPGRGYVAPSARVTKPAAATRPIFSIFISQRPRRRSLLFNALDDNNDNNSNNNNEFVNRARIWYVDWITEEHRNRNGAAAVRVAENQAIITRNAPSSVFQFVPLNDDAAAKVGDTSMVLLYQHVAETTWNWCAHFIARYNLCPWAEPSVQGKDSIRIYCVHSETSESQLEDVLEAVATDFVRDLTNRSIDPNTAIALVVLVSSSSTYTRIENITSDAWFDDFASFYDWFVELEERWPLIDQVRLAPFHPTWQYSPNDNNENNDDVVAMEKQSPYATISLVSAAVIDKAGPAATEKIAANNEAVLQQMSTVEWKAIYDAAVHRTPNNYG